MRGCWIIILLFGLFPLSARASSSCRVVLESRFLSDEPDLLARLRNMPRIIHVEMIYYYLNENFYREKLVAFQKYLNRRYDGPSESHLDSLVSRSESFLNRLERESFYVFSDVAHAVLLLEATGAPTNLSLGALLKLNGMPQFRKFPMQAHLTKLLLNSPLALNELRKLSLLKLISLNLPSSVVSAVFGLRVRDREATETDQLRTLKKSSPVEYKVLDNVGAGNRDEFLYMDFQWLLVMLQSLDAKPGSHIVDLGSGESRLGLVVAELYKQVKYTGIEFLPSRSNFAKNALSSYSQIQIINGDFMDPQLKIPNGDFFYIFNPNLDLQVMRRLFDRLHEMAKQRSITIVVTSNSPLVNELDWLKLEKTIRVDHLHLTFDFYRSTEL